MAEYIEREALLSELQEEIDFETSMYTDEQNKYFNMGLKCAVRDVKSQPTADVVPKSEVERLQAEVDQLHALLECGVFANSVEDWQKFLNEKRAEVAREIFEEIDNILYRFSYPSLTAIGTINVINAEGYHLRTRDYAELKKKYI